jgi:hypothetical protein
MIAEIEPRPTTRHRSDEQSARVGPHTVPMRPRA